MVPLIVIFAVALAVAATIVYRRSQTHGVLAESSLDALWRDAESAAGDVEKKLMAMEKLRSLSILAQDDASVIEVEHRLYEAELAFGESVRHFKVLAHRFRQAVITRAKVDEKLAGLLARMEELEGQLG